MPVTLSHGKNHQGESSEEYSTEDCSGGRGLCPETNEVTGQAGQTREDNKISQQEEEQYRSGMEIQDGEKERQVDRESQRERFAEATEVEGRGGRADENFFGEMPGQQQNQQQWKADRAGHRKPCFIEGELEPAGEEQHQNQRRGRSPSEPKRQLRLPPGHGPVEDGKQQEAGQKEKYGQVVAVEDADKADRNDARGQQKSDGRRREQRHWQAFREGGHGWPAIRRGFCRVHFPQEGRDEDGEAKRTENASERRHIPRKRGVARGAEELRGPGAEFGKGGWRKQNADVSGARDHLVSAGGGR